MGLLFLISLHLFLILIYLILIETKKSRLTHGYLLFALCFPFVGEACLLMADIGKSPADYNFVKPFKSYVIKKQESISQSVYVADEITREQLLQIIKSQPSNLVDILKNAMSSQDVEVVHIAASAIMRAQREYENKIKLVSEMYFEMPDNMKRLQEYIFAINEYYQQGLLNGEASKFLLEQEEELLKKYLLVLPEDKTMGKMMIENLLSQQKYEEAVTSVDFLRYLYLSDVELWMLSIKVYTEAGQNQKLKSIVDEAEKLSVAWSHENKTQWLEFQKGLRV